MARSGRLKGRTTLGFWSWVKDNSDQIKIAFALAAGLYAVFEYRSKDYGDRVKNSSDAIEKFQQSSQNKSLAALETFWADDLASKRRELSAGTLSSKDYHKAVLEGTKSRHRGDVTGALQGLKSVSICVIQGRCEPITVCHSLAQRIQDFRCNFRDILAELTEDNANCVLDEINYLVDTHCTDWMRVYTGAKVYRSIEDNACLYDPQRNTLRIGDLCKTSIVYKRERTLSDVIFR